MPAKAKRDYTQQDRDDLLVLKARIGNFAEEDRERAAAIFRRGLDIQEVRDRHLYRLDGARNIAQWLNECFEIKRRQGEKYLRVVESMTEEQARKYGLELEGLYQIAIAPDWLRAVIADLFQNDRLSATSVQKGRVAAMKLRRTGATMEAAWAKAKRVAKGEEHRDEVNELEGPIQDPGPGKSGAAEKIKKVNQQLKSAVTGVTGLVALVVALRAAGQDDPPELAQSRALVAELFHLCRPLVLETREPDLAVDCQNNAVSQQEEPSPAQGPVAANDWVDRRTYERETPTKKSDSVARNPTPPAPEPVINNAAPPTPEPVTKNPAPPVPDAAAVPQPAAVTQRVTSPEPAAVNQQVAITEQATVTQQAAVTEQAVVTEPAVKEEWHVPVTRAFVAHLTPEEQLMVEKLLVMGLAGGSTEKLCLFAREVADRMTGASEQVRKDLECWTRNIANRNREVRWPYLYNFFTVAQLPEFRWHLHCLRGAKRTPEQDAALQAAWAYWPLEEEPLDLPEGTTPEEADLIRQFRLARKLCEKVQGDTNAEAMSWAWCEASDLVPILQRLTSDPAP